MNGVPRYEGYLRIYWISSRGQPTIGGPPAWGLGEVLTTTHFKKLSCYETFTFSLGLVWSFGIAQGKEKGHEIWHVDLDVDGRVILKWIFRKRDGGHGLYLAQKRDGRRALVSVETTFGLNKMWWIFWLDEDPLPTQEGFCSMECMNELVQSVSQSVSQTVGWLVRNNNGTVVLPQKNCTTNEVVHL